MRIILEFENDVYFAKFDSGHFTSTHVERLPIVLNIVRWTAVGSVNSAEMSEKSLNGIKAMGHA